MVVSGRVNPFECTQSHPTKKNTASVSLHLKKSTQLMAQIMVFCFFFGKGCSQFFQTSFCWWQQKNIKVHPPKKTNWTFSFSRCNVVTFLLQQHGGGAHLFKDVGKGKGITATSPEPGNVKSENTTIHGFVGWLVGCYVVGSWWLVVVACWSFRVKPNWDLFEKHSLFLFERTFWKSSSPKKGWI